jgi:hypothetical protein
MTTMTFAEIAASVKVTAELMGSRAPTEDALTVLVSRLKEHSDVTIKATLKWLGENETGAFTLQKLMKALASAASQHGGVTTGKTTCVANGCPMLGSIFSDGDWHCRFHIRERRGPKADAITTALRRNIEKLDAIATLSNTRDKGAFPASLVIEEQVMKAADEEIERNKAAIDRYNEDTKQGNSAMDAFAPLLRKWGVQPQ